MMPVYPKDNGSIERVREAFRKKVANWNWEPIDENEYQGKPRGRKPAPSKRIANVDYNKKRNQYNWFD